MDEMEPGQYTQLESMTSENDSGAEIPEERTSGLARLLEP